MKLLIQQRVLVAVPCVAACANGSPVLFVSAKVSQSALLPQGQAERKTRVLNMVAQMDKEGFGNCGNIYDCQAECPKGISVENIERTNREYLFASMTSEIQKRPDPAKHPFRRNKVYFLLERFQPLGK